MPRAKAVPAGAVRGKVQHHASGKAIDRKFEVAGTERAAILLLIHTIMPRMSTWIPTATNDSMSLFLSQLVLNPRVEPASTDATVWTAGTGLRSAPQKTSPHDAGRLFY